MVIIFLMATLVIASNDEIKITVNYMEKYNELSKPENFDPNRNAWPDLQKAFEALVPVPKDLGTAYKSWPTDMNQTQLKLANSWAEENQKAIEYLIKAARKPYSWQHRISKDNNLMLIEMSELSQYRTASQILIFKAKTLANENNFTEAFKTLNSANNIGSFLSGRSILVEQLVSIACRIAVARTAIEILHYTEPDVDDMLKFQKQIERATAKHPINLDFTLERLTLLDSIQRQFTDDGKGSGYMSEEPASVNGLGSVKIDRAEIVNLYSKEFEYITRVMQKTPAQLHEQNIDITAYTEGIIPGNPFLKELSTAYNGLHRFSYRCRARTDALIVALALKRYKIEKGQLPDKLEQLVIDRYIKKLPVDPFSGKNFVYRKNGDNFILYSFANDLDDDKGSHNPKWAIDGDGDFVFWPIKEQ